jgi:hypothetical protein
LGPVWPTPYLTQLPFLSIRVSIRWKSGLGLVLVTSEGDGDKPSQKATVLGDGAAVNVSGNTDSLPKSTYFHLAMIAAELLALVGLFLWLLTAHAHGG